MKAAVVPGNTLSISVSAQAASAGGVGPWAAPVSPELPDPASGERDVQRRRGVGPERHAVVPAAREAVPFAVGGAAEAERGPGLVGEFEVDLGVRAHAHRLDHRLLRRRQARQRQLDVAQRAEREREHHEVGDHGAERPADFEGQRDRPVAVGAYRDEHVAVLNRFGWQLVRPCRRSAGRCRR